jgi:hypothetical protein
MGFAIGIYYRNLLSMHEFHEKRLAVILTCAFHISWSFWIKFDIRGLHIMPFYILSFMETDAWKPYFTWENKLNFALIFYIFIQFW